MKKCPFCYEEIQDNAVKCKHCGSMLASDSHPPTDAPTLPGHPDAPTIRSFGKGSLIDERLEVVCKLGEGGMGRVYLVRDRELDGELRAVKVLPHQVANDLKAIKDLRDEAIKQMSLSHENIVMLYHYAHDGETHYLEMEYVNGIDLQTYLGVRGKLSEPEVRRIGIEVAGGLRHAHGQSPPLVHRDIKPANILLASSKLDIESIKSKYPHLTERDIPDLTGSKVKLTDFGIARVGGGEEEPKVAVLSP